MTNTWKKEIELFESDLKNVPDSHKPNVLNCYLANTHNLMILEGEGEVIDNTHRHSFNLATVIWKNSEYLKKYLKIVTTPQHSLFFRDMSELKQFARKNKCIIQRVVRFDYKDSIEGDRSFYRLFYYNNTNIFKYYLQYAPIFKKKSVDNYVPRKFSNDSCPYK